MISQVSERTMHLVRWVLVVGWLLLIFSLFYDPISDRLSDPDSLLSPFRDQVISLAVIPNKCVQLQGECLRETPYPMGTRFFWGMIVPNAILIVLLFGHETWRRICPLYFLSQIPRALGLQPKLGIDKNFWLIQNHLYVQFAGLFIGLTSRILFINSARLVFGFFLIFTIFSAITIVFLYGGRSWCHYVCPFGVVQMVFTGPRGLLDSQANKATPRSITQSMCRTIDSSTGQEKSACINCKSSCMDIDAEKSYWKHLTKPGRRLVQYGYLGLVSGYFIYYYLYAGNFNYYFSGAWTHEENQLATLFKPGFYLFNQPISIPKLVTVPLTLAVFVLVTCWLGTKGEKALFSYSRKRNPKIERQQVLHKVFSLCTFIAFNAFFIYGGRPEILRLPFFAQASFNAFIVLVSTFWLHQTWGRSYQQYNKEGLAYKLRRQLKKLSLDFSQFLEGRSLEELNSDELYVLATVLPSVTKQEYYRVYKSILQEALEEKRFEPNISKEALQQLRQKLQLKDQEHDHALSEIIQENPELLNLVTSRSPKLGKARTKLKAVRNDNSNQSGTKPISQNYLHEALTQMKPIKTQGQKNSCQDSPTQIKRSSEDHN
ncbi:MAG: 4Fe-4S binding protein [Waterburya sp.]